MFVFDRNGPVSCYDVAGNTPSLITLEPPTSYRIVDGPKHDASTHTCNLILEYPESYEFGIMSDSDDDLDSSLPYGSYPISLSRETQARKKMQVKIAVI